MFWTKLVVPSASELSKISSPTPPPLGRPSSASFILSRVTLSLGTMMTLPSLRSSKAMPWRSRSLMMPEESSTLRSVNRVVIWGVVTRMITKPKKPISAAVTATIAINREAPRPFRKSTRPCKPTAPEIRNQEPTDWANIAYVMVSIWLTEVKGRVRNRNIKKIGSLCEADFSKMSINRRPRLLAILLDAGGAQAGQAMLVDRELPGKEFVDRQRVTAAGLFEGEQAAAHGGNDFGLTANDPPFGPGRGQIRNRQRTAVRPDDVFYPRAMGFCHGVLTNSQPLNSQVTTYAVRLKICLSPRVQYE